MSILLGKLSEDEIEFRSRKDYTMREVKILTNGTEFNKVLKKLIKNIKKKCYEHMPALNSTFNNGTYDDDKLMRLAESECNAIPEITAGYTGTIVVDKDSLSIEIGRRI